MKTRTSLPASSYFDDALMPKRQRWLIVSKMVEVIDAQTLGTLLQKGVQIGGGWCEVHQHILVNSENIKETEALLESQGYTIHQSSDGEFFHPETRKGQEQGCGPK